MVLHNFNLRMLAEDLVRIRRPDDRERYAASQRQAWIDRIHDVITEVGERLREWGAPQGYIVDTEAKAPTFYAYRNTWLNRRRDDALVFFSLEGFAPLG